MVGVWVFFILGLIFGLPILISAITSKPSKPPTVATPTETVSSCTGEKPKAPGRDAGPFNRPTAQDVDANHVFVATIKTYCGDLKFKIDPREAPEAARSFVFLARKRWYNGLTFDRIVAGLGVVAASQDPGYSYPVTGGAAGRAPGDLLMADTGSGRISAEFAVLAGPNFGLAGAKIGTVLEGDEGTLVTLSRLMAQPRSDSVPSHPLFIIHIDIQEFART